MTAPRRAGARPHGQNALAKAKGNFYVKLGWTTTAVPFDHDMDFTLRHAPGEGESTPAAPPSQPGPRN